MATDANVKENDNNGTVTLNGNMNDEEMLAQATAIVEAAKKAKREEAARQRAADKLLHGEKPNAPHQFVATMVKYMVSADAAFADDDAKFRAAILQMVGLADTAAKGANITTARDFEVIGGIIANMTPTLPVA